MSATKGDPAHLNTIFRHFGVAPVINGCGIYTDLGGSRLSPRVWAAMEETNRSFVRMTDLLDRTGERIAGLLGADAARVTPGAAAAIMLGTAACMAGTDGTRSQQLPDTTGMRSEVLIQAGHRYKYDRQTIMTGARLVEIGSANGTRADQFEAAITERTAMILHPAHLDAKPGTLTLEQVASIANKRGVPVLVDAAYMNYPTGIMGAYLGRGADLVAISAKYFGGPNAGGFIMGRKDLVAAVANVHFTRYESGQYLKYGRPLKMDRQIVVAVAVALEEWLEADHEARFANYVRQVDLLRSRLSGLRGLSLRPMNFTMDERFIPDPVNCLLIGFNKETFGLTATEAAEALKTGSPSIMTVAEGDHLAVVMDVLKDHEVLLIGDRIRELSGS
ncbi:MAG: D-glucosaminate-6-phosphate ammonia-lyase [Rhodospirillaceae bacterium]|jgi:L-seryl-tRNA(Ser) seleniumtransferase|nr:D-glucosaminate-6-phosphate ammonia-lyase [Rhodospirillaceae bacterium]